MVSLSMIWCLMSCPFLYARASVLGVQGFVCTGSCNRLAVSLPSRWNGASLSKLLGLAMSAIQTVLAYAGFVPRWPLERAGLGEAQVAEHVRIGLGPEELPHKDAEEHNGGGRMACDENTSPWRAEDPLHVQLRRLVEGHGGAGEGSMVAVRHISQAYTWDCGLTCLQMVLEYVGYSHAAQRAILRQVETKSVWTVDLLFALREYVRSTGRLVLFATTTTGVCNGYEQVAFYARALEEDSERILRLFRSAPEHGLLIFEVLRDLLCTGRVLIVVLVDSRHIPGPEGVVSPESFEGHYILLTGFVDGAFSYQDPAYPPPPANNTTAAAAAGLSSSSSSSHRLQPEALDVARKSFGTDEDILIIEVGGAASPMAMPPPASSP